MLYWTGSSTKEAKDSRRRWMEKWAWNMTSNLRRGAVSNPHSLTWVRTDTKGRLVTLGHEPWLEKDGWDHSPSLHCSSTMTALYMLWTHSQSFRQSTLPHSHKQGEYEADQIGWCGQICWLCIRDGDWMWTSGFPQGMCLPQQRTAFQKWFRCSSEQRKLASVSSTKMNTPKKSISSFDKHLSVMLLPFEVACM